MPRTPWGEPKELVKRFVRVHRPTGRVLDLGTGEGHNALYLAQQGLHVTGVDIEEGSLYLLRARARNEGLHDRITTVRANIARFPIQHEYDVMLSTDALHFLPTPELKRVLDRMKTKTRPGGFHVISVFTKKGDRYDPGRDVHFFAPGELRKRYKGWKIHHYQEHASKVVEQGPGGGPLHNTIAYLIAQKPLREKPRFVRVKIARFKPRRR